MNAQEGNEAGQDAAHQDVDMSAGAPKKKRVTFTFALNLALALFMSGALLFVVTGAFVRVGLISQSITCLPGTVFIIRQSPPDTYRRGQIIAYRSRGIAPLLPDGRIVAKMVAGVPGDRVEVTPNGISINGRHWGPLNAAVLEKSGNTAESVTRSFQIPDGELLLLGTLPRSYDGRYWGTVKLDQVIGRAWMVL